MCVLMDFSAYVYAVGRYVEPIFAGLQASSRVHRSSRPYAAILMYLFGINCYLLYRCIVWLPESRTFYELCCVCMCA